MTISLAHRAERRAGSKSYWNWEAWLDGDEAELDAIDRVEYRLHSSYPRAERSSRSRSSQFRISSYGWGEFRLRATAHFKDGTERELDHWISLRSGSTRGSGKLKRVFMSFAASDSRFARDSRAALEAAGVEVVSPEDLKVGMPWQVALRDEIESADALLVITPEVANTAVDTEVSIALENRKTVIPVSFAFRDNQTPRQLGNVQELHIKDVSEIPAALRMREGD